MQSSFFGYFLNDTDKFCSSTDLHAYLLLKQSGQNSVQYEYKKEGTYHLKEQQNHLQNVSMTF